jgi:protein-S-isoprenylcysteine O-methyltransferase Ste14
MNSGGIMENKNISHKHIIVLVLSRAIPAIIVLGALFFLPAWTLNYWQGWYYMAILFLPMGFVLIYLLRKDKELLERRLRMKERVSKQKNIITLTYPLFLLAFILPGFDVRLGWSRVPGIVSIIAGAFVLIGYFIFFLVIRENRFASRVIEVEIGQRVIDSGPYAVVRHPMYSGMILLYAMSPLALGSYWAMLPVVAIIPLIMARCVNEENVLEKELPGYSEYLNKVKYRLLPGIW